MSSLLVNVSPINTVERKEYYKDNAFQAYKNGINTYNSDEHNLSYSEINEFLNKYNINDMGTLMISNKIYQKDKKNIQGILEIIKSLDLLMKYNDLNNKEYYKLKGSSLSRSKKYYKGFTHIHKSTLDSNSTPIVYKAFNSISEKYDTAARFAKHQNDNNFNIVLELYFNNEDDKIKSINVKEHLRSDDEAEIILERNTQFSNFRHIEYDKKNNIHIYSAIVSKYTPTIIKLPKDCMKGFSSDLNKTIKNIKNTADVSEILKVYNKDRLRPIFDIKKRA